MKKTKLFNLIYLSVFSMTVMTSTSCDKIPFSPCIDKEGKIVLGTKKDEIEINVESKGVSANGFVTLTALAKTVKNDTCKEIINTEPSFSYKWKADNGDLSSNSGSTVSWNGKGKATVTVSVLVDGEFKKDSTITVDDAGKVVNNNSVINSGISQNASSNNTSTSPTVIPNKDVNLGEGLVSDVNSNRKNVLINIKNYLNEIKSLYNPTSIFNLTVLGNIKTEDNGNYINITQDYSMSINEVIYDKIVQIRKKYKDYIFSDKVHTYLPNIDFNLSFKMLFILTNSQNKVIAFYNNSLELNLYLAYSGYSVSDSDINKFWQSYSYDYIKEKGKSDMSLSISSDILKQVKESKIIFSKINDFSKYGYSLFDYGYRGSYFNSERSLNLDDVELNNKDIESLINEKISKIEEEIQKY